MTCLTVSHAQVNAYARVTSITNGSVLVLSNVNQTYGTFASAGRVLVIQMQGASISNNGNNSSFGNLASLNSTGLFEVCMVTGVNAGATSMTLAAPLVNGYSTANRLQVVSYPQLGTGHYTTTASVTGLQ